VLMILCRQIGGIFHGLQCAAFPRMRNCLHRREEGSTRPQIGANQDRPVPNWWSLPA
jgi:hypothetical protein